MNKKRKLFKKCPQCGKRGWVYDVSPERNQFKFFVCRALVPIGQEKAVGAYKSKVITEECGHTW